MNKSFHKSHAIYFEISFFLFYTNRWISNSFFCCINSRSQSQKSLLVFPHEWKKIVPFYLFFFTNFPNSLQPIYIVFFSSIFLQLFTFCYIFNSIFCLLPPPHLLFSLLPTKKKIVFPRLSQNSIPKKQGFSFKLLHLNKKKMFSAKFFLSFHLFFLEKCIALYFSKLNYLYFCKLMISYFK